MVMTWLGSLHPVLAALVATLGTWAMTALGAACVFVFRSANRQVLDLMLGFAAGVMLAASYWSLLAPAIELSAQQGLPPWLPPAIGFLAGGFCLWGLDKVIPHLHLFAPDSEAEGIATRWRRSILLVSAITLHNIPEGLAVGVSFGAAAGADPAALASAVALAIGIGLQNFPEGLAVALPLRREGLTRRRCFFYGQLSAVVEPVAAVAGAAFVLQFSAILPYALAFAAGAMVFVVVEELIPESHSGGNADLATLGTLLGFVAMMILDVAFAA